MVDITEPEDAGILTDIAVSVTGPANLFLAPAQTRIYTYMVTNTGDKQEILKIDAVATQNWATLTGFPMGVTLDPDTSKAIIIKVTVPAGTTVGSSDVLTVTAHSTVNPSMMDAVATTTVVSIPTTKDQCKNNGFGIFGYVNQGQCIQYFNTGK